jgi:hypothetical protein
MTTSLIAGAASVFLVGVIIGVGALLTLPSFSNGAAQTLIKSGLGSSENWLLIQRANSYDFVPVEYDETVRGYRVNEGDEGKEEVYEDHAGMMHTVFQGTNIGLATEDARAVVDSATAKVANVEAAKTDGGSLAPGKKLSLDEVRSRSKVGEMKTAKGNVEIVNPFVRLNDAQDLVDLRDVVTLLKGSASPETPRRAARNAAEAERAFDDLTGLKQNASLIAAAMVGGVLVYLGMTGGSGGGGGGSSSGSTLPIMLDIMTTVM